jgi:hypothetical protein
LKQTTSAQAYIVKFREILEEIDDISEKEAKTYFMNGLKSQVRKEVRLKDLTDCANLDEVEELAFQIDHILFTSGQDDRNFLKRRTTFAKSSGPVPMEGVTYGALSVSEKTKLSRERRCFKCKQKDKHADGCTSRYVLKQQASTQLGNVEVKKAPEFSHETDQ